MKDYRDQHKVCIAPPGEKRYYQLCCDGEWVAFIEDTVAHTLHDLFGVPWSTDEPLPEGVVRYTDGRLVATVEVARPLVKSGEWTAHYTAIGGPLDLKPYLATILVEVRRVPQPKTEWVPWHEAVRDGRALPGLGGKSARRCVSSGVGDLGVALVHIEGPGHLQVNLSADGMVEVLVDPQPDPASPVHDPAPQDGEQ